MRPMDYATSLTKKLKSRRYKYVERCMSELQTTDIYDNPIILVTYNRKPAYAIVRDTHVGKLLGNEPLNQLTVKFSGFRRIGSCATEILHSGVWNAIQLSHYTATPAVVVDQRLLADKLV